MRERPAGSKRWELRAYGGLHPVTGREVRKSRTVKGLGRRQAEDALRAFVREVEQGSNPADIALSVLFARWIEHVKNRGRAVTTIDSYELKARAIVEGLGDPKLSKLTPARIDGFYDEALKKTTPATVAHYHRVLSAALRQAERWGWVDKSPTRNAQPPSVPRKEIVAPDVGQMEKLITRATGEPKTPEAPTMLWLAWLTGMRRGELCGLQWGDVDVERGVITVRRSIWQRGKSKGVKDPKTHQQRRVMIDDVGRGVLAGRLERAGEAAAGAEVELAPSAYVFSPDADGSGFMLPDTLTRLTKRLTKELGIPEVHLHSLRHGSATHMLAAGIDPVTVAKQLGHADPSITLRVYGHVLEDRQRAAAAALGRLFPKESALNP